jgi:hypothetical protein
MRDEGGDDRSGGGARFFLRSGDTQLRVVCGDNDSTRECVEAALMMFNRVQQPAPPRNVTPPAPTPGSPTTPQ